MMVRFLKFWIELDRCDRFGVCLVAAVILVVLIMMGCFTVQCGSLPELLRCETDADGVCNVTHERVCKPHGCTGWRCYGWEDVKR